MATNTATENVQCSLRMEESLRDEIKLVSKHFQVSMNEFILDAIRQYLPMKRARIKHDLSETLRLLKQYSDRDPNYEKAIEKFAAAEVSGANPIEGKFYDIRTGAAPMESTKPETSKFQELDEFLSGA